MHDENNRHLGRLRRKYYWQFTIGGYIFCLIVYFLIKDSPIIVNNSLGIGKVALLIFLTILLLGYSVGYSITTIMRLHDVGSSGWFIFISCIPIIGYLLFLGALFTDSEPYTNKYGPDPKRYER